MQERTGSRARGEREVWEPASAGLSFSGTGAFSGTGVASARAASFRNPGIPRLTQLAPAILLASLSASRRFSRGSLKADLQVSSKLIGSASALYQLRGE